MSDIVNFGTDGELTFSDVGANYFFSESLTLDEFGDCVVVGDIGSERDAIDAYSFTVTEMDLVTFSLTELSSSLYLQIYNDEGQRITFTTVNDAVEDVYYTEYMHVGDYYLYVSTADDLSTSYTMTVDATIANDLPDIINTEIADTMDDYDIVVDEPIRIVGIVGDDDLIDTYNVGFIATGVYTIAWDIDDAIVTLDEAALDLSEAGSGDISIGAGAEHVLSFESDDMATYSAAVESFVAGFA